MRTIARDEGTYPSTVLRSIRRHEERVDEPPDPPPEPPPMNVIAKWYGQNKIDAIHVKAARDFQRDPEAWRPLLPTTMWELLNDLIVENISVTEIEIQRGWPSRSAKAVYLVLLTMLLEAPDTDTKPRTPIQRDVDDLKEQIAFLTSDDLIEHVEHMSRFNMTPNEAKHFAVLLDSKDHVVTRGALFNRVYGLRPDSEWPDMKVVDVVLCKLRKRLRDCNAPYVIETIWGTGYRLCKVEAEAAA